MMARSLPALLLRSFPLRMGLDDEGYICSSRQEVIKSIPSYER